MTRLPEKELLSGTKTPRTTTGEMKLALGSLRDFLAELSGEDSANREVARKMLGIGTISLLLPFDSTDYVAMKQWTNAGSQVSYRRMPHGYLTLFV